MLSDNKLIKFIEDKNKSLQNFKNEQNKEWITVKDDVQKVNKDAGNVIPVSKLRTIAKSIVPSNFKFSRSNKANSDLGVIKTKCFFNITLDQMERFSFFSILRDHIGTLEKFTGISSRGIHIKNLKLLWQKSDFKGADGYVFYKYCPKLENISCSSTINKIPGNSDIIVDDYEINEYANLSFFTSVGNGFEIHFMNSYDKKELGDVLQKGIYVNETNPFLNEEITNLNDSSQIHQIAKGKPSNEGYNFITLNLSRTDNDILLSKFRGKMNDFFASKTSPKVQVDIEITVEDYIQNCMDGDFNVILLRDFLMTKRKAFLTDCYNFAKACDKPKLANIIKEIQNNRDANSYGITVFKAWMTVYKSLLNISLNGLTKSSISKLKKIYDDGKIYSHKEDYPSDLIGILRALASGVELGKFNEINKNLTNGDYVNFEEFLFDVSKLNEIGNVPIYLGDDYRLISALNWGIVNIESRIREIETKDDPTSKFLAKQRILQNKHQVSNDQKREKVDRLTVNGNKNSIIHTSYNNLKEATAQERVERPVRNVQEIEEIYKKMNEQDKKDAAALLKKYDKEFKENKVMSEEEIEQRMALEIEKERVRQLNFMMDEEKKKKIREEEYEKQLARNKKEIEEKQKKDLEEMRKYQLTSKLTVKKQEPKQEPKVISSSTPIEVDNEADEEEVI